METKVAEREARGAVAMLTRAKAALHVLARAKSCAVCGSERRRLKGWAALDGKAYCPSCARRKGISE